MAIKRKDLMELYNLTCKNIQWSWAFVNHKEKYIVVQIFQEQSKNMVYSPEWGNKTQASHSEYKEYLDLVKNENYSVKAIQAIGYLDPNKNIFKLTGYYGILLDARLEIEENDEIFYYPKKNTDESILDKRLDLKW